MVVSKHFRFTIVTACLVIQIGSVFAQRPNNASVCDYYAQARFGANSSETQLKWIQNVVCLAFEGGSRLTNVSSEITGILRPGKYNNIDISLLQYFNGSRASTNVNNVPIGINWMDQGGTTPLASFLAGESQTPTLAEGSNQQHLFVNFFVAFGRSFGCTLPPKPLPNSSGPISLAYAHKFMNLEYHQLGYFINQLSLAAVHFGVSAQDADTFRTSLNSRFNVRCAPGVSSNPSSPPMLLSLCQNPTCPLAVPVSDCAAYVNLTAVGVTDSKPTTATVTTIQLATGTPSSTGASTSPAAAAAAAHAQGLSTGGIAGVAVAGAAILLAAIIALFYFRRKRRMSPPPAPEMAPATAWDQQNYASPTLTSTSTYVPKNNHQSYLSTGPPASEMDTSRHNSPPGSPQPVARQGYQPYSEQPNEMWTAAPVEMSSARTPGPAVEHFQPPQNAPWSDMQRQSDTPPLPSHGHYSLQPQYAQPQPQHHAQQQQTYYPPPAQR